MMPHWLYYVLATVLALVNFAGAALNLLALPGNWLVLGCSIVFAVLVRTDSGPSMSWQVLALLGVLALVGEGLEMLAGTAGAAKQGASRRSLVLSVVGSVVGSIAGAVIGIPVPVIGSAIAALLGGALGAFLGGLIGEDWKGRDFGQSWSVGQAAFWGRIWGTVGKTIVGLVMAVIATADTLW
ncbi:MAG: DUF456 family protein [Pirellulales bacterium]